MRKEVRTLRDSLEPLPEADGGRGEACACAILSTMGRRSFIGLLPEPTRPRRRAAGYALAVLGTAALVAALLPFRGSIRPLSLGFVFLALVVVSAGVGGIGPGIVASVLDFLAFNFFFIPPYGTFVIARAEDVVVLFVFLGVSVLISILLARATDRAEDAEAREAELRMLQELSRVLVVQGPGVETYETLLGQLVDGFGFDAGALFVQAPDRGLEERVSVRAQPGEIQPGWDPASRARAPERLPLSVGGRTLGLIVLRGDRPPLTPAESRVLRAISDQLALVLERDRLLRAATEAEVYRQGEQMRKSLLAAVSHDLRSPLAAIKASVTDLLSEDVSRSDAERRDVLQTIDKESDRLNVLIANLLDMGRIEAGVLKARIQVVNVNEAVTACADQLTSRWPSVDVRTSVDEDASLVRADPAFLDRVIFNLLDNGAKTGWRAGRPGVEVEVRPNGRRTTVRVIDHGEGVPASVREQLFFPFYGLREREQRLGPGLGLAIAKGFLSLMDGEIWVEDTPGGGATFAFSLPRWSEAA
jgi:two-component system sensor histidine kinase KdpD